MLEVHPNLPALPHQLNTPSPADLPTGLAAEMAIPSMTLQGLCSVLRPTVSRDAPPAVLAIVRAEFTHWATSQPITSTPWQDAWNTWVDTLHGQLEINANCTFPGHQHHQQRCARCNGTGIIAQTLELQHAIHFDMPQDETPHTGPPSDHNIDDVTHQNRTTVGVTV